MWKMRKIQPIKPGKVGKKKLGDFPDVVLESFNELIAENFSGDCACVVKDIVVDMLVKKGLEAKDIYKNHWLDVEDVFRKAGWKVEYIKPEMSGPYDAYFKFSKKNWL